MAVGVFAGNQSMVGMGRCLSHENFLFSNMNPTGVRAFRTSGAKGGSSFCLDATASCYSSHLQFDDLLLDLLALGDKSVYWRVRIGPGWSNLRLLPFVNQVLDIGSQSSAVAALHGA